MRRVRLCAGHRKLPEKVGAHASGLPKEGDVFAVSIGGGRFCRRAGHLDRGRKKDLPHWDLPALREFARWANRQLRKSGAELVLIPGKED